MEVFPILSWQAQLRRPSVKALEVEKYVLQAITSYPFSSIMPETLQGRDSLSIPVHFRDLTEVSLASRLRVFRKVHAEINDYHLFFDAAVRDDGRNVRVTLPEWRDAGIIPNLEEAHRHYSSILGPGDDLLTTVPFSSSISEACYACCKSHKAFSGLAPSAYMQAFVPLALSNRY